MRHAGRTITIACLRSAVLCAILCAATLISIQGAESAESNRAFLAARGAFESGFWERARNEFQEFSKNFPDSDKLAEAILLQAQSRYMLKDYVGAADLLAVHSDTAGELGDQFLFWQAEAQYYQQFWAKAAKLYGELLDSFPKSQLRLEGSYGQARATYKLDQLDRTIVLLSETNGVFQTAARTSTNETKIIKGNLLLAEALFYQKRFRDAEEVLDKLYERALKPEDNWDRLYWLASSAFADQRSGEALNRVTDLVEYSVSAAGKPFMHANALMLKAEIFKEKNPDEAIDVYEEISKIPEVSKNQARQAVLKMIQVMLTQDQVTNAVHRLEVFLSDVIQNTNAPRFAASDQIRLTLGELHLKRFRDLTASMSDSANQTDLLGVTNLLGFAKEQFDTIINTLTNSAFVGKAHLNRGWCFWEEGLLTGRISAFGESQSAFQSAVERLAVSDDQAVARFKWADCEFKQRDFTNAVKNYRFLIENYGHLPVVKSTLFDRALNHIVRASIEAEDFVGAKDALEKTLAWFPTNRSTERCLLLYGQELFRHGQARKARETMVDFEQRYPDSESIPEARLVGAETFVSETNWQDGLKAYDEWVGTYTNHALLPQAEFDRARTYDRAGRGTNALALFTNYVARFSTNPLAELAQFWVGSYYFNQRDYENAESSYKLVKSTSTISSGLGFRAWLMAGESALLQREPSKARSYLTNLVFDPDCPEEVKAEALFVWGEVELLDVPDANSTNRLSRFENAIPHFSQILTNFPSSRLVPEVHGKLGNCYFQEGEYEKAKSAYVQVIASRLADWSTRSQAEVALAVILEKEAALQENSEQSEPLLLEALDHYLTVFFENGLRDGEQRSLLWFKEAGLPAGRLAERLGQSSQAARIYERLLSDLPELPEIRATVEQRLAALNAGGP